MAKYIINDSTLTGIADAIREKTESTEEILVSEMGGLIRSITTGAELTIIVSVDSGATVMATKGDLSVSAVSNGTATLKVPEGGTWTVTATLDGKTATASVELKTSPTAAVSFFEPDATFANNSWSDIIKACQMGKVPDTWAVGNSKTMTINGADYVIDIIGKNHDEYSDGSGYAPLTFQMHDCYGTKYQMNSTNTNAGGWTSCAMRTTHLPAILSLMPSEVQVGIKEVNKLTSAGNRVATIKTTADKLFLLSEFEVFGTVTKSVSGEGSQYAYYYAGNNKKKNFGASAVMWCERSPQGGNAAFFCAVNSAAVADSYDANYSYGVAFAFCF